MSRRSSPGSIIYGLAISRRAAAPILHTRVNLIIQLSGPRVPSAQVESTLRQRGRRRVGLVYFLHARGASWSEARIGCFGTSRLDLICAYSCSAWILDSFAVSLLRKEEAVAL